MTIMVHPTQDMDISSSFASNNNLLDSNSSTQFYEKEIIMDERDETDLAWMPNGHINVSKKYKNQEPLDNHSIGVKSCDNRFQWLTKFNKLMCSSVGHRSYQLLKHLISLYTQNILTSINTYCEKALDMINLKNHLSNTLIFFHLYWHDVKEHVVDYNSYLNEVSMLLGIYIDIECKTFMHSMDSSKIASKLVSALWIYLCNSERHIFRVLLNLKIVTKKCSKIYDLILMRSFNRLKKNVESLTDTDYVRYLLVLKLWQRIRENIEEKDEVNIIALALLGPCIPKMRSELLKIIPKPPTGIKAETIWLLQSNTFDLKSACYNFIAFERNILSEFNNSQFLTDSTSELPQNLLNGVQECYANCILKQNETSNIINNRLLENEMECSKLENKLFPMKKRNRSQKHKSVSKLKPGEVVLIDLTEEDELNMDKKEKKRKGRIKLEWLKMMKRKYKVQRRTDGIKCKTQVEIADAHSTDNSENIAKKVLLDRLPISDNKVSESTERCPLLEQKAIENNTHYNSQSLHEHILSKSDNDVKCMYQQKQCDTCTTSLKQTDIQRNKLLYLLKLLSTVGQSIKEPKAILNLLKEGGGENVTSCQYLYKNTVNECGEINTRGSEELFSQPKRSIETVLSKECQSSNTNIQPIKQELPTNADCNISDTDIYCQNESLYIQRDCHLRDFKSMNSCNSQITEITKGKASRDTHKCIGCCKKIETKPFSYHNSTMFSTLKNEDATQTTIDVNTTEKKSVCDKNIICMLSDLDKCMDVLNRIGEHIMTVHAEKQRLECVDKMDGCAVSTTVSGNQSGESSCDWIDNFNSLNSEKINKIIELYGKKDALNICNCQGIHKCDSQGTTSVMNNVKCEVDNCENITGSTSIPKEYRSFVKDHAENKSPLSFVCSLIKSEFEQPIKKEDNASFGLLTDECQNTNQCENSILTNNQSFDTELCMYDLNDAKESNQDIQSFSQKNNMTKPRPVGEFENIDILDSILNGDITIEDEQEIWDNSQTPLISPISYDNSNNVLNCITELFSQNDHTFTTETEEKYVVSDAENSQTPLPEGSLAATGLLNSLFDFDLTSMDSPSNDFLYSSIQTINPRLIKKNFADENSSTNNYNTPEVHLAQTTFASEKNDLGTMLSQKEKELCSNQNIVINSSVNVVGFGLNSSTDKILEFPSVAKNTSPHLGQSSVLINSDNMASERKELFPKYSMSSPTDKFHTDSIIDRSYIFQKKDITNQVQIFNDTTTKDLSEIPAATNIPSNVSINYTLNQQNDVQSSHKYSCVELETSPLAIKQSLDSYDLLPSTDMVSYNIDTSLMGVEQKHENSTRQKNIPKSVQRNCRDKQSYMMNHRIEINAQCRSSKRSLRCNKNIKVKKRQEKVLPLSAAQPDQNDLGLRCSQITVVKPLNYENVQNTRESPLPTFHMSYHQKSPKTVCTSKNIHKQLKCVGIQQLRNISQRKQQIVLNFHEDSTIDKHFNEDLQVENSQYIMEDLISEDSSTCVSQISHTPETKACFQFSKRNPRVNSDVTKVTLVTDEDKAVSNNIFVKSSAKWSLQNVGIQPLDEDTPSKRRKVTTKFLPNVKTNAVMCAVNQQKIQKKHFAPAKEDLICTNRRKNMVSE